MTRRVVVTGMGCVTPIGLGIEEFAANLMAGRVGVRRLSLFDASNFPVRIAAEVPDWDAGNSGSDGERWRQCPRQTSFAIYAALQAKVQSGIGDASVDPTRFGVYLGCGEPFEDFDSFVLAVQRSVDSGECRLRDFTAAAAAILDAGVEREFEPDMPALHIAELLNAQGPNQNCIAACVSSTQAIGEAARIIRGGEAEVMLCGGAHSTIHPFGVTGFHRLSALSTRNDEPAAAVRPFDVDRDGFVIGEGGAAFIIEELDHARRRGAEILGELTGYGSTQDAFRVTDTHPEGRGNSSAIVRALNNAGLNPEEIDYINAHGTGTILNDRVETQAIKRAFGEAAYAIPVSSTKSMLGHATTACGAIELAVCLIALRTDLIPPTVNHDTPDPDCDLDYVPGQARAHRCRHVLNNNIGFGGQNAALIVSRYEGDSAGQRRTAVA